jgi:type VI secretion system ImpM family protein
MATRDAGGARPGVAGWFGKIPALGDFVARRLRPDFIEAWDHWLCTEMVAARKTLGSDWSPLYLSAPIWRFALTPGVLGACHWYGVLTPSMDRVGRHFPLTFVASGSVSAEQTNGWWAALIAAAHQSRGADCDAEALDAMLVSALEREGARPLEEGQHDIRGEFASADSGDTLWAPWEPESGGFGAVLTFHGLPQGPDFLKLIVADRSGPD